MKRRKFIENLGSASGILMASTFLPAEACAEKVAISEPKTTMPGIWKYTIGNPEKFTPQSTWTVEPDFHEIQNLPGLKVCPVKPKGAINQRGVLVKIPVKADVNIYGLGLQLQSFQQNGLKKMLRVNADPEVDSGDSHAPVPFFVTSEGYGILVDTARNMTIDMGKKSVKTTINQISKEVDREILIEIPRSSGVDIYIFGGPTMLQAVQRYNLFCGGGALPPRWGLGFWYRVKADFSQEGVEQMAGYFRENKIPCDVLGLEPKWQTHAYSCSYVWSDLFPNPGQMVKNLKEDHFRVNLWEHAFVHSSSPIYNEMLDHSGDYEVWGGLVPDFLTEKGRRVFADFHREQHVDLGISGYKADECDNSDYTKNWSYPDCSQFPSGVDGEQMHSLIGVRYQDTLWNIFKEKKERTYGLVRASGAMASPYPFVLYSDLYDHNNFIHGVAQSGFSGLLWTPEVRHASSNEDLIRRLQSVVFSPLAMVNAWYLKNAPWKQIQRQANNEDIFAENWELLEDQCRKVIEMRMKLIPYIHAAFVRYHQQGIPPFRALVLDYPDDSKVINISSQFMVGENMMVAPLVAGQKAREIYLPEGDWYELFTLKKYSGKSSYNLEVPVDQIPVFIKSGTILPLAKPTLHTDDPESWKLKTLVFGENREPAVLYEDDGSYSPALDEVKLTWDNQLQKGMLLHDEKSTTSLYQVTEWKFIK